MTWRIEARLPSYATPFVGRDEDIAAIMTRLGDPDCRLLTLLGSGGMGKTRLALEAARQLATTDPDTGQPLFVNGIRFVDLQTISAGDRLVTAMASALGVLLSGSHDPRDQLLSYLSDHDMLLVLDNFEQLLSEVDLLADILNAAPGVKLLVTSREALNMQEEWLYRVGGLAVPDQQSDAQIASYSAVQLFTERTCRIRHDFTLSGQETSVIRICQLVDGMPLALELAAGWTKALTCAEIAREIQRSLDFLTTNRRLATERHRSMQAVFDQSWRLLTEDERRVFPRLSVFRGGFRREAAEQVAGASLAVLAGLVDKSFLRLSAVGRYEIHELTRQYGEEQLEAVPNAKDEALSRRCAYYARFLYERQTALRGAQQAAVLLEIGDELDNIRASWEWAVEHDRLDLIHQSIHSLYLFCHIRMQALEGERLFTLAISRFGDEDSATAAYLLLARICLGWFNGRVIGQDQCLRAIRLAYRFWTTDEIAIVLLTAIMWIPRSVWVKRITFDEQKKLTDDFLEIFRKHDQPWGVNFLLYCLGDLCIDLKKFDEAEDYCRQSMEGFLRLGDRWGTCWSSMGLGLVFELSGRYREALHMWQRHQDDCATVGDMGGVIFGLSAKARVAWKLRDHQAVRYYTTEAIKSHFEYGSQFVQLHFVIYELITLLIAEGQHERAAELLSFLSQYANSIRASRIFEESEQGLSDLAQQLPAERYQQAIERGRSLQLRTILEQLLDELEGYAPSAYSNGAAQIDALSERELEVLRLVAEGRSNREIAQELVLTLNTVKSHIHHVYGKLGVESRTQAVARARELRLL